MPRRNPRWLIWNRILSWIQIQWFSIKKIHLKMSSVKWWLFWYQWLTCAASSLTTYMAMMEKESTAVSYLAKIKHYLRRENKAKNKTKTKVMGDSHHIMGCWVVCKYSCIKRIKTIKMAYSIMSNLQTNCHSKLIQLISKKYISIPTYRRQEVNVRPNTTRTISCKF